MLLNAAVGQRAWLKHGNRVGDPASAPRCLARTRHGTACQCPAIRGRRRCRLHGGLSTGPRTLEGLAHIRKANTRHGRYSRENVELARAIREHQRNFLEGALRMRGPMGRHLLNMARSGGIPPRLIEQLREMVRADLTRQDEDRLRGKVPSFK